jgi:hypothetical protein
MLFFCFFCSFDGPGVQELSVSAATICQASLQAFGRALLLLSKLV